MLADGRPNLPRNGALPGGLAYEQKTDGYRAILFAGPGRAFLQSRNGADLTGAFPEIASAGRAQPGPLVLDGELVVAHDGRLHFGELQRRARRRGAGARQAAADRPAHLIVFDVLDTADGPLLDEPYRERRARLKELFADGVLATPFALCPATTDRATAEGWLDPAWGAVGIEGVVVKGQAQRYEPGHRGWIKVRARATTEAVVASVTGAVGAPSTLLLGRYDQAGRLRYVARTAPLTRAARQELGALLVPAGPRHPWAGRRFTAGWGTREVLDHTPVEQDFVVEFAGDTSVDEGVYRHPVRFLRVRDDLGEAPPFDG
ncbi:ATP-dependent DNA ligase [Streptomyces longwoodensis]|uniref:ATP-dependent DNA ligase n=1 Tax=Streptomyces longwoodensis TaxID=68231 RepID=UPI002DD9BF74|nr:ATP-dependent DNA ligase [Streptomyces longwoodensis]WRY87367.1 ATP-dependent DNA ligase [Streptomyces longwoodensis]